MVLNQNTEQLTVCQLKRLADSTGITHIYQSCLNEEDHPPILIKAELFKFLNDSTVIKEREEFIDQLTTELKEALVCLGEYYGIAINKKPQQELMDILSDILRSPLTIQLSSEVKYVIDNIVIDYTSDENGYFSIGGGRPPQDGYTRDDFVDLINNIINSVIHFGFL